jgi:hypothetical protein
MVVRVSDVREEVRVSVACLKLVVAHAVAGVVVVVVAMATALRGGVVGGTAPPDCHFGLFFGELFSG